MLEFSLWIIPSCRSPYWAALCFVFCSHSARTDSWLYFPCMFSAQMHVTVQHIAHPSRDTEVCVLLVGKGIVAPMKLTSQESYISTQNPVCPSPSLGRSFFALYINYPSVGWLFLVTLRTTGFLPPWGICLCWDGPLSETCVLFTHFSITLLEPNSRSILSVILLSHNSGHLIFSPSSPPQCIYDLALTELLSYSCSRSRASHLIHLADKVSCGWGGEEMP